MRDEDYPREVLIGDIALWAMWTLALGAGLIYGVVEAFRLLSLMARL